MFVIDDESPGITVFVIDDENPRITMLNLQNPDR